MLATITRLSRSRKVIIALAALALNLLIGALPELEALRGELFSVITALALALIGGIALEDAAAHARERAGDAPQADRELIKAVVIAVIETLADQEHEALTQ